MKIITVEIPPCGHLYCVDFMGCTEAANIAMGFPVLHPSPVYPAGSKIQVAVIGSTGFAHLDWISIKPAE